MIYIGIPVVDQHDLTFECLRYIDQNCKNPESLEVVIIDNGSAQPYSHFEFDSVVKTTILRNEQNLGFYYPLAQISRLATPADLLILQHNDLFHYEPGWDQRLRKAFVSNPKLGILGVCGSDEIDDRGGRGGGTMCNFKGTRGQLQEHTGKRVTGIHQALILDSMLMAVRYPVLAALNVNEHVVPCHFMDKLWPIKAISAGWQVAVLGLEVDHQGGLTSTGTRFEDDCVLWCQRERISYEPGKASLSVYLEAERQFLVHGRSNGFIPSKIANPWHHN